MISNNKTYSMRGSRRVERGSYRFALIFSAWLCFSFPIWGQEVDDTGQRQEADDTGQRQEADDTGQRQEADDTGQRQEADDTGQRQEADDTAQTTAQQVDDYFAAIERAEAMDGAYSTNLADLYQGLGRSLVEQGKLDDAKKAFQRGLQIQRVNFGLNSLQQKTYLFAIADIEARSDDWDLAESVLQNIYLIDANNFGEKTPAMLQGLNELIRWYVANTKTRSPVNAYLNLIRAESLAEQMVGIIEHQYGLNHPETTAMLRQVSRLNYFMLQLLSGYGESIKAELETDAVNPVSLREYSSPLSDELLRQGVRNFSKIIESLENQQGTTALDQAEAIAKLGDWHMVFGQRQTAKKTYQQAYEVLAKSENGESLTVEYFGQPRLVSFSEIDENSADITPESSEPKIVHVSMTIDSSGRPQNVEILDPPEFMTKQLISSTERKVHNLAFRPRLADGKPAVTTGYVLDYPMTELKTESCDQANC